MVFGQNHQTRLEQSPLSSPLFKTPGMTFFSPHSFYSGQMNSIVQSQIPEMDALSIYTHKQTEALTRFLMGEGISMGFGVNPNRDSYFDLYGTVSVDVEMDYPAAQFGETKESEGGKRYFPDHDATHLWTLRGVGPRLKDLKDKDKMINQWALILMDAEGLSTAYNSAYQVKDYWNWRMRQSGASAQDIQNFEKFNKGVMSIGNWNYESYMDIVLANVRGDMKHQFNSIKANVSYETVNRTRTAKLPDLFPPLYEKIGHKGEEYFFKYAFAPLFAITSYLRPKSGYLTLMKSTKELLNYYYSDFYVRWADMFEVGEDIEKAKKNLAERIELFKKDQIFHDVGPIAEGRFESQRIRVLITQVGRKLIELQELNKKDPTILSKIDLKFIDDTLLNLVQKNKELLRAKERNTAFSVSQIKSLTDYYLKAVSAIDMRLPVDRVIPSKYRLGYATYTNFWSDPFAVVLDRKIVLSKFVSAKSVWRKSLQLRYESLKKGDSYNVNAVDLKVQPELVAQLENQLSHVYNLNRSSSVNLDASTENLKKLTDVLNIQFENFRLQIAEYQHLTWEQRIEILESADELKSRLLQKINELSDSTKRAKSDATKRISYELESQIQKTIESSLYEMTRLLQKLDYSALRSMKVNFIEGLASHLMHMTVEGFGESLKLSNLKNVDFNYTFLYKKHLNQLKSLTVSLEKPDPNLTIWSTARRAISLKPNQAVCLVLSKRCIDPRFIEKVANVDLIDKKENHGPLRSYNPINEAMDKLIPKTDALRVECSAILGGSLK